MRSLGTPERWAGLTQRTAAVSLGHSYDLQAKLPSHLKPAARAGLTTLLIAWLALALFFAPYWAAQTNFPGHQHPDGVPPHTHTIQAVISHALIVVAVVAVLFVLQPLGSLPLRPALWLECATPRRAHGSRAPPQPF